MEYRSQKSAKAANAAERAGRPCKCCRLKNKEGRHEAGTIRNCPGCNDEIRYHKENKYDEVKSIYIKSKD